MHIYIYTHNYIHIYIYTYIEHLFVANSQTSDRMFFFAGVDPKIGPCPEDLAGNDIIEIAGTR